MTTDEFKRRLNKNPPRITLIAFKSRDPDSDKRCKLDEDETGLQVGAYAICARKEHPYQLQKPLVQCLDVERRKGAKHERQIPMDDQSVAGTRKTVTKPAWAIRGRQFKSDSAKHGTDCKPRCVSCDSLGFYCMGGTKSALHQNAQQWRIS